jgi:hypothetical protein
MILACSFGGATLASSTLGSGWASGLRIECQGGPPDEFAIVLVSSDGLGSLPVGTGTLCLGAPIGRYNAHIAANQGLPDLDSIGQFDEDGVLKNLVFNSATTEGFDVPFELLYAPAGQLILPGSIWFFQAGTVRRSSRPGIRPGCRTCSRCSSHKCGSREARQYSALRSGRPGLHRARRLAPNRSLDRSAMHQIASIRWAQEVRTSNVYPSVIT